MIKDPLHREILKRLGERLDPDTFERAVPDLLRPHFGLVVPVPGGSDGGFDAAIVDGEGEPIPVICTTGKNVIGNLRSSLTSNLASGYQRRTAIVATSQELTPRQKANLSREARKLGFQLAGILDRQPLASLLYDNPRIRRDLLGIGGAPRALAALPEPGRYPVGTSLIAREEDLQWVHSASGDRLLMGVPGSGKTALAAALVDQGKALFVRPHALLGDIMDAYREQPTGVFVVDDAHVNLDLLRALRSARQDAELEFAILATTWPGQRDEVAEALGIGEPTAMRTLELLTRDEILQLYRELDLQAPQEVMRELVDQAVNRPGLAVTLATLWKRGAWEEVVRGAALTAFAARAVRHLAGGRHAQDVLAAFSLGGARGASMAAVSEALGVSVVEVKRIAVSLGAAGVIAERGRDALAVEPAQLRSALLTEVFFSGRPKRLDHRPLLDRVEDRSAAVEAVVHSLLRGGQLEGEEARAIVSSVGDPRPWTLYAHLGPREARWVLDNHPGRLVDVARAVLEYAPGPTLDRLLAEAYPPPESLGSTPGHPLRIIRGWIRDFDSGPRTAVAKRQLEKRRTLTEAVLRHAAAGGRSEVLGPALCAVLDPVLESWETDAGSGRSITVSATIVPLEVLEQLGEGWDRLRGIVVGLNRPLWSGCREVVRKLSHPMVPFGGTVPDAERHAARALAARIVSDLLPLAEGRPGRQRELARLGRELGVEDQLELDSIYELLFPESPLAEPDYSRWAAAQRDAVKDLAAEWSAEDPKVVVERVAHYRREAADAGHTWPDSCPVLAEGLAACVSSPRAWLESILETGLGEALGGPFLAAVVRRREPGWQDALLRGLESDNLAPHAVALVLTAPDLGEDLRHAAIQVADRFPRLVETLALRREIAPSVLHDLLAHGGQPAAQGAAIGHWLADPRGTVDAAVDAAWRAVILNTRGRGADGEWPDDHVSYWLGEVLKSDADLAEAWLDEELVVAERTGYFLVLPVEPISHAVRALAPQQRRRVLANARLGRHSSSLVSLLVGDDAEVFRSVLARDDLRSLHLAPLRRCPDPSWWSLARIALDLGCAAGEVARATFEVESEGWSGSESSHRRGWVEAFAAMRDTADPRLAEVARLGEQEARARLADATRREREEAMRGPD